MADAAIERQLAHKQIFLQSMEGNLVGGGENADRNGEVIGGSVFREVCGRKIRHIHFVRELQAAVFNGAAHPFAAFAHRAVRQADDREHRLSRAGIEIRLHFNNVTIKSDKRAGVRNGEHSL